MSFTYLPFDVRNLIITKYLDTKDIINMLLVNKKLNNSISNNQYRRIKNEYNKNKIINSNRFTSLELIMFEGINNYLYNKDDIIKQLHNFTKKYTKEQRLYIIEKFISYSMHIFNKKLNYCYIDNNNLIEFKTSIYELKFVKYVHENKINL